MPFVQVNERAVAPPTPVPTNGGIIPAFTLDSRGRSSLLWTSIGLAVLTSLFQGLITTIVAVSQDANMWTFRFRVARYEHWWWLVISTLLSVSFALIVLSFLAGNNNDALGVLALSTATAIAIVRYAIPAWRNRDFIENRWLVWTEPSRTAIESSFRTICGPIEQWKRIAAHIHMRDSQIPSDRWGFAVSPPPGLAQDPTDILLAIPDNARGALSVNAAVWPIGQEIYDDGIDGGYLSLLWGRHIGFRPRVSRAINSMPLNLLSSRPFTINGYAGEGLCLAMGVLGRTKGLQPWRLVYDESDSVKKMRGVTRLDPFHKITAELESTSSWYPRPNKVMRSYYSKAMIDQYSGLGTAYCNAATEIALLFLDVPAHVLKYWLENTLEQQSMEVNLRMSQRPRSETTAKDMIATPEQLNVLYRAHFVSTVVSLNYFADAKSLGMPVRPDLICFALLYLAEHATKPVEHIPAGQAEQASGTGLRKRKDSTPRYMRGDGAPEPTWWQQQWVRDRLKQESRFLTENYRRPTAWLLGLIDFPDELLHWPKWPNITYEPRYNSTAS